MEETKNINKDSSKTTVEKLWRVTKYRKKWSIAIYSIIIIATIIITLFVLHKKYESEAIIIVDKTSSTNLADINPYVLEKLTGMSSKTGGGLASILSSISGSQTRELDIIKSPLVLDRVIKENDIRYDQSAGMKAGKLMTTEDFLRIGGVDFENRKDTNIIKIKFKSKNPQQSHDVVTSIINIYKEISEKINTKKASQDKKFLKEELFKCEKDIAQLSQTLKEYKIKQKITDPELDIKLLSSVKNLNPYRKDYAEKLASFPQIEQTVTGLKLKLKILIVKYSMLKEKYEWAFLVEQMSKNATNIVVLKQPEVKELWDKVEPKLSINLIIAITVATFIAIFWAFYLEFTDVKLTYMTVKPSKTFWLSKNVKETYLFDSVLDLKKYLNELNVQSTNIINFGVSEEDFNHFKNNFANFLKGIDNYKILNANEKSDPVDIFNFIESSPSILFVSKIGMSNKEVFCKTEEITQENNKLLAKVVLF